MLLVLGMKTYTTKEVLKILKPLGIAKSRLQYYHDTGILVPLVESTGPGTLREYTSRNMAEVLLAMKLTKIGVSVRTTSRIILGLPAVEANGAKELLKLGIITKEDRFSVIEPDAVRVKGDHYLSIEFKFDNDPEPHVHVGYYQKGSEPKAYFPNIADSGHVVLVNLTRIRLQLEEVLI